MTQPVRIKRSRQHKQISPNGLPIRYVGRGSKWGNPFRVVKISKNEWAVKLSDNNVSSAKILIKICRFIYTSKEDANRDAVKCYIEWFLPKPPMDKEGSFSEFLLKSEKLKEAMNELKGKNLSCWCGLNETCHADFLLYISNK